MGGHGGLNILPQKKWNVYNFENREKVRKDEEAAAKEEQLKREQSRKRDTEFRLEQLRAARGLAAVIKPAEKEAEKEVEKDGPEEPKSNHINLFEGIKIFDPIKEDGASGEKEENNRKNKKVKREEVRVVTAEDEKYRLGYGLAGKGVKLPWYLEKRGDEVNGERGGDEDGSSSRGEKEEGKKSGKKTLEELREERLQREKREKCRERQLLLEKRQREGAALKERRFSRSSVDVGKIKNDIDIRVQNDIEIHLKRRPKKQPLSLIR